MRISLVEHSPAEWSLRPDQAGSLRELTHIDVRPGWREGSYTLVPGSTVGIVKVADDLELAVRPKLPVRRVVHLLAQAAGLASWDDSALELDDDADLDAAAAGALAAAAQRAFRRGPRSDYHQIEAELAELRGRIDIGEQQRRFGLPLPLSVVYDEFSPDVLPNQMVLGAAILLLRSALLPETIARSLRVIVRSLDGVRPASVSDADLPVRFDRLNEEMKPVVAISRAVLKARRLELESGVSLSIGFTVDMNRLFESYLERRLRQVLEPRWGGRLYGQRSDHLDEDGRAGFRPDLTWMTGHRPLAVIDAKYKVMGDARPSDSDLYQLLAYCTALGLADGHLVFATSAGDQAPIVVRGAGVTIWSHGLDLAAPAQDLRSQVEVIARRIGERTPLR